MEIDKWIEGCKVRVFPWIDGKRIYVNVQYYRPGQSLSQKPVFDRSVYLPNDESGERMIKERIGTLVNYICQMEYKEGFVYVIKPNF